MIIKNKLESLETINRLELNRFPEQIFTANEETKVKQFIENNPAEFYAIRDKSKAGGIFKLKVAADKVLEEIDEYSLFSINISSINYVNNQLLVGEVEFLSDGEVYATLSLDPAASVRDALKKPEDDYL